MRGLVAAALVCLIGAGAAAAEPRRIVAAGAAITETVFALGAGELLVGIDTTSVYPAATASLPKVGYLRALAAEGVLSLRPDLLLASADAGPPVVLEQLRATGLAVVIVPESHDGAGVVAKIRQVGSAIGRAEAADRMAGAVESDLASLSALLAALPAPRPKAMFLLGLGGGTALQAAGSHTGAAGMLDLAGADNAVHGYAGYKPLAPEAAVAAGPDFLLMTRQGVESAGGAEAVLALPALKLTPAAASARLLAFDAAYLLGWGPRTAHAARDLAAALHPRDTVPALPDRPWLR